MVLVGIGNAGLWSLGQVLVLGNIDDKFRGRVMSVFMMNFGLMPLVLVPAGILADNYGPRAVVGTSGIILMLTAVVVGVTQRKLRELQ